MNIQEQLKIEEFRKQALYYSSSEGKRFKILIETVTGCFGSCLGCAFTENEKFQFTPKIEPNKLPILFKKLQNLLNYNDTRSIIKPYETTVINYGGSEHFIYDNDYLGELFFQTSKFFHSVLTKRNVLAFSSSGLMNTDKMFQKSRKMLTFLDKEQFVVDFVIDLNRFEKLQNRYQKSLDFFRKEFGFVDLAINLESFSDLRDWNSFCQFVNQNGILNVDIIYAINKNNQNRVKIQAQKIFDIYEKVVLNTKQGKSLFDLHHLLRIKNEQNFHLDTENIQDICQKSAYNILKDGIFIDSQLDVYPILFVLFADVPLNDRLNFPKIGNLLDDNFLEKYQKYHHFLVQYLMKIFLKNKQCYDCPYKLPCYKSGSPLLNPILNESQSIDSYLSCENPVKPFLIAKEKNYLIHTENDY